MHTLSCLQFHLMRDLLVSNIYMHTSSSIWKTQSRFRLICFQCSLKDSQFKATAWCPDGVSAHKWPWKHIPHFLTDPVNTKWQIGQENKGEHNLSYFHKHWSSWRRLKARVLRTCSSRFPSFRFITFLFIDSSAFFPPHWPFSACLLLSKVH